jgi:hypothetical protein
VVRHSAGVRRRVEELTEELNSPLHRFCEVGAECIPRVPVTERAQRSARETCADWLQPIEACTDRSTIRWCYDPNRSVENAPPCPVELCTVEGLGTPTGRLATPTGCLAIPMGCCANVVGEPAALRCRSCRDQVRR